MRLSDIMGRLDLSIYPQIALVLFLAIFISVMVRTFSRSRLPDLERAAGLPLEDDANDRPPQSLRTNGSNM